MAVLRFHIFNDLFYIINNNNYNDEDFVHDYHQKYDQEHGKDKEDDQYYDEDFDQENKEEYDQEYKKRK